MEKVTDILESRFEERMIKSIRQKCFCNENGRLEETADYLKQIYVRAGKGFISYE